MEIRPRTVSAGFVHPEALAGPEGPMCVRCRDRLVTLGPRLPSTHYPVTVSCGHLRASVSSSGKKVTKKTHRWLRRPRGISRLCPGGPALVPHCPHHPGAFPTGQDAQLVLSLGEN